MAVTDKLNNLKQGPKEDKVVVAGGIAVSVVIVLLAAWAILFLRSIQNGSRSIQIGGGPQDQFNFTSVNDAQQQLQAQLNGSTQEQNDLQAVHQEVESQGSGQQMQTQQMQVGSGASDQFGTPGQ